MQICDGCPCPKAVIVPNLGRMSRLLFFLLVGGLLVAPSANSSAAAAKGHVIAFGNWTSVKWLGTSDQPQALKVRPLIVDGRGREYTLGIPHEVTERLFVVQRAFRLNDSLPEEPGLPRWQWQRGGWLLVDRSTGHITALNLVEFDANDSAASWYRDYVAYCGVSEDGKKISAVVVQLSRRKPLLKKVLAEDLKDDALPGSACPAPAWQRTPVRVGFEPSHGAKQTFAIRGRAVDVVSEADDEEEASK
jgi:hypothetical protein